MGDAAEKDDEFVAAILDMVGDAVVAIDASQRIRKVNREAERIFARTRGLSLAL